MKRLSLIFLFVAFVLSGCGATFTTNVTTFHDLDANMLASKSYAFDPSPGQQGNLEFQTYAKLVAAQLQPYGMSEAAAGKANFLVSMDYGIDDGKTVQYSYPIYGQTGYSGATTSGSVYGNSYSSTTTYKPTYGFVGSGTTTDTVYTRFLTLRIAVPADSPNTKPRVIYEAKAVSKGSSSQLAKVMPYMVRSVFQDFPGQSGSTRTVDLNEAK